MDEVADLRAPPRRMLDVVPTRGFSAAYAHRGQLVLAGRDQGVSPSARPGDKVLVHKGHRLAVERSRRSGGSSRRRVSEPTAIHDAE
jgi:hypothetical protein